MWRGQRPNVKRSTAPAVPTGGGTIELNGLTKSFGEVLAVDDVHAVALPGKVTALLGPNGAGKTTALRMLLGLVAPDTGTATFGGTRYADLPDPVRHVGAVL